jgi:hypothetical protein
MPVNDPRNNVGRGAASGLINKAIAKLKSWGRGNQPELANQDTSVFDLSGPAKAVSDWDARQRSDFSVHSQPGTLGTTTPVTQTAAQSPVTAVDHNGNPMQLGQTVTIPGRAPRKVASKAAAAAPAPAATPQVVADVPQDPMVSQNYGEYTGEPDSRIYAPPVLGTPSAAAPREQTNAEAVTAAWKAEPATTTYGDSSGVYQLKQGENAPVDMSKLSVGDAVAAKLGMNMRVKQAGIDASQANNQHLVRSDNTAMLGQQQTGTHYQNQDAIAAAELPTKIDLNKSITRSHNVGSDVSLMEAPTKIEHQKAATEFMKKHGISMEEATKLGWAKLDIAREYNKARITALSQKSTDDATDFKTMLAATDKILADPDATESDKAKARKTQTVIARGATTPRTRYAAGTLGADPAEL